MASYWLELYDLDGNLIETISMGQDREYFQPPGQYDQQQFIYRVRAVPVNGALENVYSNYVDIIYRSLVEFPNVFTPNGDGLNDLFTFKGRFISEGSILIYNRWGELIFETDDISTGWDGRTLGKEAIMGTYIYRASLMDETGVPFIKTGQVLLLR